MGGQQWEIMGAKMRYLYDKTEKITLNITYIFFILLIINNIFNKLLKKKNNYNKKNKYLNF